MSRTAAQATVATAAHDISGWSESRRRRVHQPGALLITSVAAAVLAAAWIALSRSAPLIALAPVIAVSGLLAILLNRQAAAYIMLASLPFAEISIGNGVSMVRYILLGALTGWLISASVFESLGRLRLDRTDLKLLLWALASIASAVIMNSQAESALAQTYLNLVMVYYLASRTVRNPRHAKGAILALTIGLGMVAVLSLTSPKLASSFTAEGTVQRLGPIGAVGATGINRFADWMAVGVVLPWLGLEGPRRPATIVARGTSIAIFAALVATVSKGAIIALGLGLLCWAMLIPGKRRVHRFIGIASLLVVGWFMLPTSFHERFSAFTNRNSDAYSRFAIWEAGLKMFVAHPWFGVGVGNYDKFAPTYFPQGTLYQEAQGAHNILIGALAETGIVGTTLLAIMIGTILLEGIRLVRADRVCSSAESEWPGLASSPEADSLNARATIGVVVGYLVFIAAALSVDLQRDRFFVALAGIIHGLYRTRYRALGQR
jgi:O-antigen ligase